MRYANLGDVLAQLKLDPDKHGDRIDRVIRLEAALCQTFDERTGTAFGAPPVAETRTLTGRASPRLILTTALRSVTGIATGGRWDGSQWDGATTLDADRYRLANRTAQGYHAIDLMGGSWYGAVHVTGVWADQLHANVPDDVVEALTFITVETYRQQTASPADQIGPDGMMVQPRNPWAYEQVKAAINRHTVVQVTV